MGTDTQHVPYVEKFECTDEFRTEAIEFSKNGMYTQEVKGTKEYIEYWKKQDYLCKHGMTNSKGITITGIHYFYLNFIQILLKDKHTGRKKMGFPRFLDIDYDYFHLVDVARAMRKGLIFTKPRRTGFSYKDAALVTYEYNFFRDSISVIGAFHDKLSTTTMNMVLNNMNFLNANTEWRKQRNPDTKEHVKSQYQKDVGGVKVWTGYKSEVMKLTFKDNPFASVGKSTSIFIFEEAGTFVNLKQSFEMTEPCWKDGDDMVGIPIVFGTGGDMEGGTADFADMFYHPSRYNMLEFNNVWEPGREGTKCGWFIPATRGRLGGDESLGTRVMVDDDGNSLEDVAYESIQDLRTRKRLGGDPKAIQGAITQYPLTPSESFLRTSGAIFSGPELMEWLSRLETTPSIREAKKKGELYFGENNKIDFKLNPDLFDLVDYPLGKEDNKTGCVVIWEDPIPNAPWGLYVAGCDPYDQDNAENSDSLGSVFIYKRIYHLGQSYDLPVAEYTGRPALAVDFYEIVRKLCIYYNAKCLYENQLKGLKIYFEQKNSLQYLFEQPEILKDIVKNTTVNRGYGIHMTETIKTQGELWLRDWLYSERQGDNDEKILNLHTIKSIPLLKELVAYDRELNTDRVIAFMCCIIQLKEMHRVILHEMSDKKFVDLDPFFKRKFFNKNNNNNIK